MSMGGSSRVFDLLQQWRIPSSRALFQTSTSTRRNYRLPKDICPYLEVTSRAALCLCRGMQSVAAEVVDKEPEKPLTKHEKVGAFQKLPMVMPAIDILTSAQRKARNVSPTKGIQNIAKRERNKGAKRLDTLMKELAVPLRTYTEKFPNKKYLHPYERSLIDLTFGEGNYDEVLGRVDSLRKKIVTLGKQQAALCAQSSSKLEAEERLTEGLKKIEEVFQTGRNAVDDLLYVAKRLRAMPVVDPQIPTLCLVGAPNVGKSSLVRILSTGKPEVTDTPGLLTRDDDDRNDIEKLTLAVLSHLPTAVLYVHDLTGECGTSPDDQYITYKNIRGRFKDHLWLDVVSKSDLLRASAVDTTTHNDVATYKCFGPDGAIRVSVMSGAGVDELKARVQELLISQSARIRSEMSTLENHL